MRRGEREKLKERPVGKFFGVLLQTLDRVLGHRGRGEVIRVRRDGRQRFVVLGVAARREIPVVILEAVGVIETVLQRLAVHVPFAGVIRAVAGGLEHLGQQPRPRGPHAARAARQPRHPVAPHLLRVITGENRRARRPAARGVVKLCEPHAALGERVELRRRDVAAVTTRVGETHVVGQNEENVRALVRSGGGRGESGEEKEGKNFSQHKRE